MIRVWWPKSASFRVTNAWDWWAIFCNPCMWVCSTVKRQLRLYNSRKWSASKVQDNFPLSFHSKHEVMNKEKSSPRTEKENESIVRSVQGVGCVLSIAQLPIICFYCMQNQLFSIFSVCTWRTNPREQRKNPLTSIFFASWHLFFIII